MKKLSALFCAVIILLASGCEKSNEYSVPLTAEKTETQSAETSETLII